MSRFLTRIVTRAARCSSQRLTPVMTTFKQSNVQKFTPAFSTTQARFFSSESNPVHEKIDKLVNDAKVVVFMKGEQTAPQCGFSNAVVQILKMHDVTFESHNVLADEEIRQGIKEYSNWPTIPQVYVDKEFIGGCDILLKMHQDGSLIEVLGEAGIRSALVADEPEK